MSIEVNLRSLSTLAYKLQDDVKRLVICTSDDQNFRRENEERMTKMMYEVQTVKAFMAPLQGLPPATRADIDRVQHEMREISAKWHKQIEDVDTKLDALEKGMRQPPKPVVTKSANPEPITPDTTGRETRAMTKAKAEFEPSIQKQQSEWFPSEYAYFNKANLTKLPPVCQLPSHAFKTLSTLQNGGIASIRPRN
jgi:hypothetical protein